MRKSTLLRRKQRRSLEKDRLKQNQEKLLHKLYFKEHRYFGRDKLYQYVRDNYPKYQISRRQVMAFLKKNEVSQLFQKPKKTKDIKGTVLSRPYQQIGIDLADMQNMEHDGFNYILTAIDLFSKKAWARAIAGKTEPVVLAAMTEILEEMPRKPSTVRSDNGSEFINAGFKQMLKDRGIKQIRGLAGKPQSNGQIENFNGSLKRLVKMFVFQTDNQNWPGVLQQLVDNYNETPQLTTKVPPDELAEEEGEERLAEVKERIRDQTTDKNEKHDKVYRIGDRVRLKLVKSQNYKQNEFWTRKVFTIYKVHRPRKGYTRPYYYVKDDGGHKFTDKLYNNDVQVIADVQNPIQRPETEEVSKLLEKVRVDGRVFYKVLWKVGVTTLEPRTNLMKDIPKMVRAFERGRR